MIKMQQYIQGRSISYICNIVLASTLWVCVCEIVDRGDCWIEMRFMRSLRAEQLYCDIRINIALYGSRRVRHR